MYQLHPLFLSMLGCGAGILIAYNNVPYSWIIALLFILIALFYRLKSSTPYYLIPISLVVASVSYKSQLSGFDQFYHLYGTTTHHTAQGIIHDIHYKPHKSSSYSAILTLISLDNKPLNHYLSTSILIFSNQLKKFKVGDTIELNQIKFKPLVNESLKFYLIKQQCFATYFVPSQQNIYLVNRPDFSIKQWFHEKKNQILNNLQAKMNSKTFSFFAPLFLGYKPSSYSYNQLKEHFRWWGLSHYLARSGLHLILFICIWRYLFGFVPIPYNAKNLIFLLLSFFYFVFTWSSTPIIRAFLTFTFSCLACLGDIQTKPLHLLTIVTYFILLINPVTLFALDFQLSFGLTFALLLFNQNKKAKTNKSN